MTKFLSALFLFVMSAFAHAADVSADTPPTPEADPTAIIVFAIIFVGMIAGFAGFVWWKERERRRREIGPS
ncbi:MAG: hypothetical protein A3G24_24655 [Betaproteobacteria bacterium RIFCSPLOWO2_12_FULL_62_13]|nr:MAG: hypothetical protein A3G24_24655 [Betaproteobacteria bacterium RIFCSPLOWO2_12_FULL_62_13]